MIESLKNQKSNGKQNSTQKPKPFCKMLSPHKKKWNQYKWREKNEEIRIIIYQVIKVIFPICLKSECVQIEFPLNVLLRSLPKVYNSRLLSLLECTGSKVAEQDCQVRGLGSI